MGKKVSELKLQTISKKLSTTNLQVNIVNRPEKFPAGINEFIKKKK